jgi:DNA end-binding protein Ku
MPARSEWKGFLQVHQLRVAVKAFSAASTEPDIALNQLHRDCGERIRQQKVCPKHGLVESEAIISGYQVAENCYLPLDPAEIEQLRPESDKTISVECFVDHQTIDPVFHTGRTLYLVPDGPPGQRPFSILREGMKTSGRHAFSRIVMSRRELLVLLRPMQRLIAMTVVEYAHRVRPSTDYESEVSQVSSSDRELQLIGQLIEALTDRNFEMSRYRDRYQDGLSALIEQRIAAADLTAESPFSQAEQSVEAADEAMVAVLEASLLAAGIPGGSPPDLKIPLGHAS